MKFNLKDAFETFTDEQGNNPLTVGTSLLTFGKTIPFQIAKSVVLSVLVFVFLLGLLVWLGAPTILIIIASIGGFVGMIAMGVTGVLKFITDAFFSTIYDLISSLFHPIDKVYDDFRQDSRDPNISKKDFFGHVLQDVVKPKVNETIGTLPFGSKISSRLDELVENILKEDELAKNAVADTAPATNFSEPINTAIQKSTRKINAPFRIVFRWVLVCWAVVFLILLALNITRFFPLF